MNELGIIVRDARSVTPIDLEHYKQNGFEPVYAKPYKKVYLVRKMRDKQLLPQETS